MDLGPRSLSVKTLSRLGVIALAIQIGVITHVFWDSFTHRDYWLTKHWHFLSENVSYQTYQYLGGRSDGNVCWRTAEVFTIQPYE